MKYYYGIIYLNNGQACVSRGCLDEETCMRLIKESVAENPEKVIATTYITRTVEDISEGNVPSLISVFGNPRSRDVMQDKKFRKELLK